MTRTLAAILISALTANCATTAYPHTTPFGATPVGSARQQDPASVTAAYVKTLPAGARLRVRLVDGETMKGTLMVAEESAIVVRPRTRVPEPARTIPLDRIASIELERDAGIGRAVAIGAAVGAGAAIGVFLAILVAFAD